ncbi:MAG: type 1 glutamine amidotransferase [Phycisphaerales bacterium]|nr:type 1 glutamine amidotransferase [Phycisphaerales bacterium]
MNKVIVLQHVAHMGPGRIVPIFRDFGIPVEVRLLHAGDEVPDDIDELRALVVLDGPADLPAAAEKSPALASELALLKRLVAIDRPVLGIGLGAQLLAMAGGAKVYPNAKPGATPEQPATPLPELGWLPVKFPFPGGTDPLVGGLHDGAMMFHWHHNTFDLPKLVHPNPPAPPAPPPPTGNSLLASSAKCRNQVFRFKDRLLGFQFHFELTQEDIQAVVTHATPADKQALGGSALADIAQQTKQYYPAYQRLGDLIIRNVVQYLRLY